MVHDFALCLEGGSSLSSVRLSRFHPANLRCSNYRQALAHAVVVLGDLQATAKSAFLALLKVIAALDESQIEWFHGLCSRAAHGNEIDELVAVLCRSAFMMYEDMKTLRCVLLPRAALDFPRYASKSPDSGHFAVPAMAWTHPRRAID